MLKALPPGAAREAELRKLSLFAAEPGAALHPDDLRQLGLPATPRRSPLRRAQPAARAEPAARSRAESESVCAEGGGWDVEQVSAEQLRCDIDSVGPDVTAAEFVQLYLLPQRPLIVRGAVGLAARCAFSREASRRAGSGSLLEQACCWSRAATVSATCHPVTPVATREAAA